jgi:filamentous hemagglutinin family protein
MKSFRKSLERETRLPLCALAGYFIATMACQANPHGGKVAQGSASFNSKGSQLTITTSDQTIINWRSFNIAPGQTTTFVEPSSTSVVWNQINGSSPSQILGNLNANGFVVLENSAGFFIGGQATITAHGLVLTTARTPNLDLSSGGAWDFSAPPPTAKIVNYGRIDVQNGAPLFLIASEIDNAGTLSAPGGQIGLYAGENVLVSASPDGRGLSAQVTLPQGSVDNTGKLIANAGAIALQAQVVNQGGLLQANSVREVNGTIELVASDAVNLGPNSTISARGGHQGVSAGGAVTIKAGNSFSDQSTSTINISGGTQGGNAGSLEISATSVPQIESHISASAASGFQGGHLTIDPYDLTLDSAYVSLLTPLLDSSGIYQISLEADHNIELSTSWSLTDPGAAALLTLTAGNNIILDDGSAIRAANNWSVTLSAGNALAPGTAPTAGNDGIYLNGSAFIQTMNGDINLSAANEVIVNSGAIRTLAGGNIDVTTMYGDVNSGDNVNGYNFAPTTSRRTDTPPYYTVSTSLGGISTAAGGNVTINAGGNVISYLPTQSDYADATGDAGSGAFGSGNVSITAGGSISGHFVLADGEGTITSLNGNIGSPLSSPAGGFALSLVKGDWTVNAPNGNIYVQDVRNPNGIFDDTASDNFTKSDYAGFHYFDYDPAASVSLNAGDSVEITGADAPHTPASSSGVAIPLIFPPSLEVTTGAGGFVLDTDVTLFPSASGNLNLTTLHGGNFQSYENPNDPLDVFVFNLQMSDSGSLQWLGPNSFSTADHAATPPELNNPNPVAINISGSIENVNIYTTKETDLTVQGNLINTGFLGENLRASDVTSINVTGSIENSPIFTFATLSNPIVGANPLNPAAWDSIFSLLVDPTLVNSFVVQSSSSYAQLMTEASSLRVFQATIPNPGFIYSASTLQLGFQYQMSAATRNALEGPLEIIKLDLQGNPIIQPGQASLGQDPAKFYFATQTVTFVPTATIESLYTASLNSVQSGTDLSPGFQIGGPGQFDIHAASIDLGGSGGILSWGVGNGFSSANGVDYSSLESVTQTGAAINVTSDGNLSLLTSTIASVDGGNVSVKAGGEIDLGLAGLPFQPPQSGNNAYGIYTSGNSDVSVVAVNDINIDSARIGTFNGGNVFVESLDGSVNAGNGVNEALLIETVYRDPSTGLLTTGAIQNPRPYGSGILALSPTSLYQADGDNGQPGNITVTTPQGNITSTLGGISQFALDGSIAGGPTITLSAGTPGTETTAAIPGNIDLGSGGVVGGSINISAQGNVSGLIVSRQNSTVNASQNFTGTVLSGGSANVAAGGAVSGTLVGVGGISASGGNGVTATLLSQSVSVGGGQATSTLGTTVAASSASQSAAQQASNDAKPQTLTSDQNDDDDLKKKKKRPVLTKTKRVTVILPNS